MLKKKLKYFNGGDINQTVDPLVALGLNSMYPGAGMIYTGVRGLSNQMKTSNDPLIKASGNAIDPLPFFSEFSDKKGTIAGDVLRSSVIGTPFRFAKSLSNSKQEKKKAEEEENLQMAMDAFNKSTNYGAFGYAPYETTTQKSLFKLGGYLKHGGVPNTLATAEVEGNEHAVDPFGTAIQFEGPNHENGGIPVSLEPGTKIFSKRLKDTNGKSFAKNADSISKKITKATNKLDDFPNSEAIKNSIAVLETQRDEVFNRQEDMKAMKAIKQTKKLMKNGGLIKYLNGGPDILEEFIIPQDSNIPVPTETSSPQFPKVDLSKGIPYAGALSNILIKNPKTPTYSKLPKTTIDKTAINIAPTKFDINPQLEKSQADVRALEESINKNISSGSNRFASSLAAKIAGMRNRNELYGQKFNVENQAKLNKAQMLNQLNLSQANMDMSTNQFNTQLINQQLENEYNRKVGNLGLTRQGLIDAATTKQKQDRDRGLTEADIQKVRIIAQRYGSGVLKRMFDKMVAEGQISKPEADAYLGLATN